MAPQRNEFHEKRRTTLTIPIYRPYVFLRCRKCGKKTDHVLMSVTNKARKGEIQEIFECQECGETKTIYELTSVPQLHDQIEAEV